METKYSTDTMVKDGVTVTFDIDSSGKRVAFVPCSVCGEIRMMTVLSARSNDCSRPCKSCAAKKSTERFRLTGDEILPNGSVIHWDQRGPRHYVLRTCGACGKQWYGVDKRKGSGLCLQCINTKRNRATAKSGKDNLRWKGGKHRASSYTALLVKTLEPSDRELAEPMQCKDGYISEHRLVVARILGRPLVPGEVIHHRNGIRNDNRPENLELCSQGEHVRIHRRL